MHELNAQSENKLLSKMIVVFELWTVLR